MSKDIAISNFCTADNELAVIEALTDAAIVYSVQAGDDSAAGLEEEANDANNDYALQTFSIRCQTINCMHIGLIHSFIQSLDQFIRCTKLNMLHVIVICFSAV